MNNQIDTFLLKHYQAMENEDNASGEETETNLSSTETESSLISDSENQYPVKYDSVMIYVSYLSHKTFS